MVKSISKKKTISISWTVEDIFVSAVLIIGKASIDVDSCIRKADKTLRSHYANYEIILINNGCGDNLSDKIRGMLSEIPCIRFIDLAEEYEYDVAMYAGLESAIGDYVCVLNQITDPAEIIPEIINKNKDAEIIQGVSRIPLHGSRIGRALFYKYNKRFMGIDIPLNATYMMSFSRKAVNAMTSINRDYRHMRHLSRVIGYRVRNFTYTPMSTIDKDRTFRGGVVRAFETITAYSTHPLRVISWIGVVAGFINFIYATYVVITNIVNDNVVEGWTTTSLQLSVMFFILFATVVIISEYLARILSEQRKGQKYVIDEEYTSTVKIAHSNQKNVTS